MHVLSPPPPPLQNGDTGLLLAARGGHAAAVRVLLEAGANPNARGWVRAASPAPSSLLFSVTVTPLLSPCPSSPPPCAQLGWSPLHGAAANASAPVLALLLSAAGVDPCAKDQARPCPSHEGLCPNALIYRPPPLPPHHQSGWAPLHRAVDVGDAAVIEALLADPRVDVNCRTAVRGRGRRTGRAAESPSESLPFPVQLGWTPLHYAVEHGNEAAARRLLADRRTDAMARDGIVRAGGGGRLAGGLCDWPLPSLSSVRPPAPPLRGRAGLRAHRCGAARRPARRRVRPRHQREYCH